MIKTKWDSSMVCFSIEVSVMFMCFTLFIVYYALLSLRHDSNTSMLLDQSKLQRQSIWLQWKFLWTWDFSYSTSDRISYYSFNPIIRMTLRSIPMEGFILVFPREPNQQDCNEIMVETTPMHYFILLFHRLSWHSILWPIKSWKPCPGGFI